MLGRITLARHLLPLLFLILAGCGGGGGDSATSASISSFAPSATATNAGRTVTLSWAVSGTTRLLLQPGAIDVTGRSSIDVTPDATTTYTLQASNINGSSDIATAAVRIYDWTRAATTLNGFVADSGPNTVTGYTFTVFDREGELYSRAAGDQLLTAIRPIASGTKLPTVLAILTLVDSGQLNLDTPVAQYLAAVNGFNWPADKAAITMRMLLTHTAGFPGLAGDQPDCVGNNASTFRICSQIIANSDLVASPGTTFNYGSSDFEVAGYIATLLANQSWGDFFDARIGTPLGMTTFAYNDRSNPNLAGGAISDVQDYSSIIRMLLNDGVFNGQRVLSSAMIAELETNQIVGRDVVFTPFPPDRVQNYPGYGIGVFITSPSLYPGSPGPEFSSPGLFGAVPWFDRGLGYGAMLLVTDLPLTGLNMWDAVRLDIISQFNGSN